MTASDSQRIEELFHQALERPPAERVAFVAQACAGDSELRRQVEALLRRDQEVEPLLDAPAPVHALLTPADQSTWLGRRIGSYTLRRVVAAGGMGVVFEAEQVRPRRSVAVKLLQTGLASESLQRRFRFESEVLGRLRHPAIAQIHEAGIHVEGPLHIPYFAMELVPDASTIVDYARRHRLDVRARIELFVEVCHAVQHGHQKGVVHRDLKPGNVLVDGQGRPKVIDFGIARTTAHDREAGMTSLHTLGGEILGTVPYMSPEQTAADPDVVDVRSDVYALGVLLYELLCGQLPYDVAGAALPEAARIIQERAPRRPSTLLPALRGDLETIVLRALAKEPERRYQSASALAADLQHFLRHEPIEARPTTMTYQIRLLARRHRVLVGAAATLAVVLVVATVISTGYALEADAGRTAARQAEDEMRAQRDAAVAARAAEEAERRKAEEVTRFLMDLWGAATPHIARGRDTALVRDILDDAAARADAQTFEDPSVEAVVRRLLGRVFYLLNEPGRAEPQLARAVVLYDRVHGRDHPDTVRVLMSHSAALAGLGRLDEAHELAREVLATRRRLLGNRDPATLGSMRDLAILLTMRGQLEQAVPLLREVREAQIESLGPSSRDAVMSGIDLAAMLDDLEQDGEAEQILREVIPLARETFDDDHPDTLRALNNLARILIAAQRCEEAEPLLVEAVSGAERVLGPRHSDTLTARQSLARVRAQLGDIDGATAELRAVLAARREVSGAEDPLTRTVQRDLEMLEQRR